MNNETEQIFLLNTTSSQSLAVVPKIDDASVSAPDVEDFSTVCRTCATVTEFVIPIFNGEGLQNNLAEKIHKHLPIQVSEQDVLPRVVCYQCASTLLAWHELVQCCVQADAALRARIAVTTAASTAAENRPGDNKESKPTNKETNPNSALDQPQKFEDIEDLVARSLEPPRYAPPATGACAYCRAEIPDRLYKEHLVAHHSACLFHCDECDAYVDRKEFILHMSEHAVEYARRERKEPAERPRRVGRKKPDGKDENENDERRKRPERGPGGSVDREATDGPRPGGPEAGDARPDEFSDHSDTADGFGPLPESVFEAIEDSQGSSPTLDGENPRADRGGRGVDPETAPPPPPPTPKTGPNKKTRTCQICGKAYTAASSYFYHMKHFHGRSRDHECPTCGKRFGTRAALGQHEPVHTGACAYGCDECGKRFRSKAGLYIHAQTHTGVKRWPCPQCPRAFRWRAQLARHASRHAAAREHACAQCPRRFSVRADLLRHARTHARGNHACPECGLSFAQLRYLKVHTDRKHPAAKENVRA